MARIRTIKPSFFKHGDLYDAEIESGMPLRIAYAGLWTIADREGRFKWKPKDIKPDVLPHDNVSMADVMTALEVRGFVQRYAVDGQEYGYIPAFLEHQHVNKNEAPSTIPAPPKNSNARAKRVRVPDQHHEERKGKERKENIVASAPFDEFWKVYPKREARGSALTAFAKALKKTDAATLIAAAGVYASKRAGQDPQFTKQPATWLNQECWADDGIAPASLPDPAQTAQASAVWDGRAAPLVEQIGPEKFKAWFEGAMFEPGPPARITFAKPVQRNWVAGHFVDHLKRAYGDFELGVAA